MMSYSEWLAELSDACEDLIQDAILIQALAGYRPGPDAALLPGNALAQTQDRLGDYLLQHALDLSILVGAAPSLSRT